MDQSPRFGTHVIHGLTDKFNHLRVKVYHLHVFWDSRSRFLCSAAAAHTEARACRERERGAIQIPRFRQHLNGRIHIHTQSYVKIPVLASILVNTVSYVLS